MLITDIVFDRETILHRFYRGMLGEKEVYLKAVHPDVGFSDWGIGHRTVATTGTVMYTMAGMIQPSVAQREQLLWMEAIRIQEVGKKWNHHVLGQGRLLKRSHMWLHPLGDTLLPTGSTGEGNLVIVMPKWSGESLSMLSSERIRQLFPSLLPVLWDALSGRPHGDLKPESIFINEGEGFFRILDPGVYWVDEEAILDGKGQRYEENSTDFMYTGRQTIFTTNPLYYPILYQYPHTLPEHFLSMMENDAPKNSQRPSAPDILAFGLMYFHCLTGYPLTSFLTEPHWFLDSGSATLWMNFPPNGLRVSSIWSVLREHQLIEVLQDLVQRRLVKKQEADLCYRLIDTRLHRSEIVQKLSNWH